MEKETFYSVHIITIQIYGKSRVEEKIDSQGCLGMVLYQSPHPPSGTSSSQRCPLGLQMQDVNWFKLGQNPHLWKSNVCLLSSPASFTLGLSVKSVFEGDPDKKSSSDSTL